MADYGNMTEKLQGMEVGNADIRVDSLSAHGEIDFGVPVFTRQGIEDVVDIYKHDFSTLTLSGVLVASNVYTITVNGTAVATPWNATHDLTMDDVKANLEAAFPDATIEDTGRVLLNRLVYLGRTNCI